jgi:hypothetical protein
METFITISEASRRAGYRDARALQAAARRGKLKTEQVGPRGARLTTHAWLEEYMASLKRRGTRRGATKGVVDQGTPGQEAPLDARALMALVANHDPATLPSLAGFAWTAPLTEQQRQEMQEEARAALEDALEEDELSFTLAEVLAADWRVAEKLMRRPEFAASVSPEWRVSDFWFYGPEWQAGEREADADLAAGRFTRYASDEEFLASLAEPAAQHADMR